MGKEIYWGPSLQKRESSGGLAAKNTFLPIGQIQVINGWSLSCYAGEVWQNFDSIYQFQTLFIKKQLHFQ